MFWGRARLRLDGRPPTAPSTCQQFFTTRLRAGGGGGTSWMKLMLSCVLGKRKKRSSVVFSLIKGETSRWEDLDKGKTKARKIKAERNCGINGVNLYGAVVWMPIRRFLASSGRSLPFSSFFLLLFFFTTHFLLVLQKIGTLVPSAVIEVGSWLPIPHGNGGTSSLCYSLYSFHLSSKSCFVRILVRYFASLFAFLFQSSFCRSLYQHNG